MYKFKKYENGTIEIFGNFLKYYNEEDDALECPFLEFTNCEMLDIDSESLFLEIRDDSEIKELDSLGEVVQTIFPSNNMGNKTVEEEYKMLDSISLLKLEDGTKRMCIVTSTDSVEISIGGNNYELYYIYDTDNNIRVIRKDKEKNIMDKIVKLDGYYFHTSCHGYYGDNDEYQREFAFFVDGIGD